MTQTLPPALRPLARQFALQQLLSTLSPLSAVYLAYLAEHGMPAGTIANLMSIFFIVSVVFEIPSGVWADRFSRRRVLLQAEGLCAVGFAVMGFFPNAAGFAVGIVLWSLRTTLYSGTFDAYLYDELAHHGGIEYYGTVRSRAKIAQYAGVTLSAAGVWLYYAAGWGPVVAVSVAVRLNSLFTLYRMPEIGKVKDVAHASFRGTFVASLRVMRARPRLFWTALYSYGLIAVYGLFPFRTLLGKSWVHTPGAAALFVAGCSGALCLGSVLSAFWRDRHDTPLYLMLLGLLASLAAWLAFSGDHGIVSALCFILMLTIYQLWQIRLEIVQQHLTPSAVRASSGSLINLGDSLLSICAVQLIGRLAGTPPDYRLPGHVLAPVTLAGMTIGTLLCIVFLRRRMTAPPAADPA